jgi:hypothetical protein
MGYDRNTPQRCYETITPQRCYLLEQKSTSINDIHKHASITPVLTDKINFRQRLLIMENDLKNFEHRQILNALLEYLG